MNPETNSDLCDLAELSAGKDLALNRIIARWEDRLFGFAWRYLRNTTEASDLVAETFVRLYRHRHQLSRRANLSAWLFTTLANLCRNLHRWHRRHPSVSLDESSQDAVPASEQLSSETSTPRFAIEKREALAELTSALNRLPHELKTTLMLYYFEGMSYREIGTVVGCSERGVETRLYRARHRLRAEWGDAGSADCLPVVERRAQATRT